MRIDNSQMPIIDPRFYEENGRLFNQYFCDTSELYKKKTKDELDEFWGECGFSNHEGSRWGPHFYYDIVLGLDPFNFTNPTIVNQKTGLNLPLNLLPCQTFLSFIIVVLRHYNLDTSFPADKTCSEAVTYLTNRALTMTD